MTWMIENLHRHLNLLVVWSDLSGGGHHRLAWLRNVSSGGNFSVYINGLFSCLLSTFGGEISANCSDGDICLYFDFLITT